MSGTHPVRPDPGLLEPLIHAAALPGIGPTALARALVGDDPRGRGRVGPRGLGVVGPRGLGVGDPQARLRALGRARSAALTETERVRAAGWARRALRTIVSEAHHVLVPGGPAYPEALLRTTPVPCPLFAAGRLDLLDTPIVAVVGTRRATAYGRDVAHRIAWGLARAGVTVISGLAAGIDGVAHEAAGPERTIGVVGSGLDVVFPRRHQRLQRAIGREGLLLSELLPGTPPAGHQFPRRNRIIAGLARAVVVIEAPGRSGALSTARQALELGATVFAVPGPLGSPTSEGTNALIRDGATLVTGPGEVLQELGMDPPEGVAVEAAPPPRELEGQGLLLWRALGSEARHIDDLSADTGLDPRRSLASLLALEIQGYARQLPGLRFLRAAPHGAER